MLYKMRGHGDGPHARSATPVRDAKCLVKIQMADIRAQLARPVEPHLCVHVGAVHVDLSAVGVHGLADFSDRLLEDSVGGRVGDHQCAQPLRVPFRLRAEILHVDVPLIVAGHDTDRHAGHHRARRVRAVC